MGVIAFAGLTDAREAINGKLPEVNLVSSDSTELHVKAEWIDPLYEEEHGVPTFVETYDATSIFETMPNQPNISSTIWRTVSDQKNRVYYLEDTSRPSVVWVDLKRIDFAESTGVRKLDLHGKSIVGGDQTGGFKNSEAFVFLAPK